MTDDPNAVLNTVHVPDDAGQYADALEGILRRIPENWGRWLSCGPGWYPLVVACDQELRALDPEYEPLQIKEKFGKLRYYYSPSLSAPGAGRGELMRAVVGKYEQLAAATCETCGQPGERTSAKTLCPECEAKRYPGAVR